MDLQVRNLLEQLEKVGIVRGDNISPYLGSIYGDLPNNAHDIDLVAGNVRRFLERIEEAGLIRIDGKPQNDLGKLSVKGNRWFDTLTIWAFLDVGGINLLMQTRQNESEERLRKSIKNVNNLTIFNFFATLLFTGAIIYLQIETNKRDRDRAAREIRQELQSKEQWQKEEQDLKGLIQSLKIKIDSHRHQ